MPVPLSLTLVAAGVIRPAASDDAPQDGDAPQEGATGGEGAQDEAAID